ncbi:MAG: hypothetical protein ACM3ZQ_09975 [Bacillota bacterium]
MEQKKGANTEAGKRLDHVADKIDHKEIYGMLGIDADSLLEQSPAALGSFGHVFHGDTANAWRYTAGMLPGKKQCYLDHEDYREQDDDASAPDELTDLRLPPENG